MRLHADHPRVLALMADTPGLGALQAIRHLQQRDTLTKTHADRRTGGRSGPR